MRRVLSLAAVFVCLGATPASADPLCTLDVDGDGNLGPLTDGLLVIRHLFGFPPAVVAEGAVATGCSRCLPDEIAAYLDSAACLTLFDADGDGVREALTDGLLVIRHLFGFAGSVMIDGAVGSGCTRCAADDIAGFLEAGWPPAGGGRFPLNDTGATGCAVETANNVGCPAGGFPDQDAEHGRDVTHPADGDGHAGFSFTKLGANGNPLPAGADEWLCVRDNVTGLTWEVKTEDGGLRDRDNTYTWYNPDSSVNGGTAGTMDGGTCEGSRCDTQAYVDAVNAQGLCGARDWRMPSRFELVSIATHDRYLPALDRRYFPDAGGNFFWSSSPTVGSIDNFAWAVSFDYGGLGSARKDGAMLVRLVRGGQ